MLWTKSDMKSLTDPGKLEPRKELHINLIPSEQGLTQGQLIRNLSFITKSRIKIFMQMLQASAVLHDC